MTDQLSDEPIDKQIAEALGEPNVVLIRKIIAVIGPERTQAFLTQTQEKITQGELLRKDGKPRTPGGSFFYLVRGGIAKEERQQLWSYAAKSKRKPKTSGKPQAPGDKPKTPDTPIAERAAYGVLIRCLCQATTHPSAHMKKLAAVPS